MDKDGIDWRLLHKHLNTTGQVVGLEVLILRVVGSYPTQWTSMYVLVGGGWLNKPL
jgi:hypothetical protein